jgi:hypothetical protein
VEKGHYSHYDDPTPIKPAAPLACSLGGEERTPPACADEASVYPFAGLAFAVPSGHGALSVPPLAIHQNLGEYPLAANSS